MQADGSEEIEIEAAGQVSCNRREDVAAVKCIGDPWAEEPGIVEGTGFRRARCRRARLKIPLSGPMRKHSGVDMAMARRLVPTPGSTTAR